MTNSSTDPSTEFDRNQRALVTQLGGRDPLPVLHATLDEISALVESVPSERWQQAPAPGEWSAIQTLNHIADAELVFGVRVRMIVTQDRPTLVGFDQDGWAARFGPLDTDPREAIARWQVIRRSNLRIWESLTQDEWMRVGIHTERGQESVRTIVLLLAGHDVNHMGQLRACLGVQD